jgi:amino acid permease
MTNYMTVFGLTNGMIGGTILVLPLLGIRTGYLMTFIVCMVLGFLSYYTAYLIVTHLGKGRHIKDSILSHFNNDYRYMTGYSFFMWFSFIPVFLTYFRLICLQM